MITFLTTFLTKRKPPEIHLKVSRAEIARTTGLSSSYITLVFQGRRIPRVHLFKRIAEAADETMDGLYEKLGRFYK